jgi:hypothetical protein
MIEGTDGIAAMRGMTAALPTFTRRLGNAGRLERMRATEELTAALAALRALDEVDYAAAERQVQRDAGVAEERVGAGIANQVAQARRISPGKARRELGWATVLTTELPHTFALLQAGRISEWRAMLVARETVFLSRAHREQVDRELAQKLESLGDRRVEAETRRIGYRLDPAGFVARSRAAENDRCVSLRPAPDAMARLTAFLPVAQGVACYAALRQAADTARAAGEPRSRGQVMADTLVERVAGQATAEAVPVELHVVLDVDTLLGVGDEPAHVDGYGPVPAPTVRGWVTRSDAPVWLRRLFRRHGRLIAMESNRRCFTPAQAQFIRLRDQVCQTPWCEAPIRHIDHMTPAEAGGKTHVDNGQGLCEACNYAKQTLGWNTIRRRTALPAA